MLNSMTGFGRAVCEAPFGRLTVEIQSVNRKYFEAFVSMPKELGRFEQEVRKWVNEVISRGQVSVRIFLISNLEAVEALLPDRKILKELKKGWEKISKDLGMDPKEITLPFLMQYFPIQSKQELGKEELSSLHSCVHEALQNLMAMKKKEGKALTQDLTKRLKELERMIEEIENQAPDATQKMRQKLGERMREIFKPGEEIEDRLLKEVALFAEKVDITEEITRFRSHIAQFRETFKSSGVGRKMDFLVQEMGREVNTIGSKSMEASISHLVVNMKSELEKMREQIQNIE